jgi:hypothetical protein
MCYGVDGVAEFFLGNGLEEANMYRNVLQTFSRFVPFKNLTLFGAKWQNIKIII